MPGLQGEDVVAAQGSPVKKSKLSLKFFQKKETKRALDFSEPHTDEAKTAEPLEPKESHEQVVYGPAPCPASPGIPLPCEKRENFVPFVGLNNLGNTCYLNSILQVLYYCPGFREGIKKLYEISKRKDKAKAEPDKDEEAPNQPSDIVCESLPAHIELLSSFSSLIASIEELQSSILLSPESFSEGELATPPRKVLGTLRQLNPMYEGFLQHDAQEVLQCLLGYIQEACDTIRKELELEWKEKDDGEVKVEHDIHAVVTCLETESKPLTDEDGQISGKRKSDTEVGNAKKKPKSVKSKKCDTAEENNCRNGPLTRSKRKSSSEIPVESNQNKGEEEAVKEGVKNKERGNEGKCDDASKETEGKRKKRAKLSWLRPSGKQPSIFSKFCSVGKISSTSLRSQNKTEPEKGQNKKAGQDLPPKNVEDKSTQKHEDDLGLMDQLFHGRLVLRTRCLECESFTERKEDFQDISVPVLDEQPISPDILPEVSPDPKPEQKSLKWAIAQFASVERIVGEDKYFCETCHHYTEAERSLLFDKTPEVITIHLKRFSANSLELDPYAGLSKVNTPLQTPLTLSLEEWCTKPSSTKGQHYQLFAVVMHSGVTISSGHYTAYIRMSDLKEVRFWLRDKKETQVEEEDKERTEGLKKDEVQDCKDEEVSFRVNTRGQRRASLANSKSGSKKLSEGGVGLLGGQRSLSSYELRNGSKRTERADGSGAAEGSKQKKTSSSSSQNTEAGNTEAGNTEAGLKEESDASKETRVSSCGGMETSKRLALNNLLEYEGKWLLFDDSEVRLFEEEDFLRACSPETCSSSTPYLLFYKRVPEYGLK